MEQKRYDIYIDGNTVRKRKIESDEQQRRRTSEREEQRAKNRKIAKRNQAREMRMNRRSVLFLSASVGVTCFVCAAYINLQSKVTAHMKNISSLEKEIADLKTENDTTIKRINTSIDLNDIKKRAMSELGMVYAAEGQISYYDIEDEDYMMQYEKISEN
ncbi:MAG: hypothetical protein HFI37_03890 [Lachnospiraceae bacterium]|nr:hypothetical protein [Lachnospiraceae bacterium]